MNASNRRVHEGLLVVAVVQGILGDVLLRAAPWGLNLVAWALAGLAGIAVVCRRAEVKLARAAWGWLAVAGGCAALVAIRGSDFLGLLTVAAGAGCLVLAAWSARGGSPLLAAATDYAAQAALTFAQAALGGFAWASAMARRGASTAPGPVRKPWARTAVGALTAVPVLAVFGALFAAADPVFARGIRAIVDIDFATAVRHVALTGFWGWIAAGYGRRLLWGDHGPGEVRLAPAPPARAPGLEVLTGLGLLSVLFASFVAVQVRYLFGDDTLVQTTLGLTYAEYARRGFFELLAVAALLIPLLLGCDWLLGAGAGRERRAFKLVAGLLMALLAAILASAWKRLGLYTAAYGLTELRLYAAAFLVWIAGIALWFVVSVLPGHRRRFMGGSVVAALAALLILHAANPDALIARHNLARAREGQRFDVAHLLQLGPDAAPVLLGGLSVLPEADGAKIRERLEKRWAAPDEDWRRWNLARARAHQAVIRARSDAPPGA